jgi:hypothetical protein
MRVIPQHRTDQPLLRFYTTYKNALTEGKLARCVVCFGLDTVFSYLSSYPQSHFSFGRLKPKPSRRRTHTHSGHRTILVPCRADYARGETSIKNTHIVTIIIGPGQGQRAGRGQRRGSDSDKEVDVSWMLPRSCSLVARSIFPPRHCEYISG